MSLTLRIVTVATMATDMYISVIIVRELDRSEVGLIAGARIGETGEEGGRNSTIVVAVAIAVATAMYSHSHSYGES